MRGRKPKPTHLRLIEGNPGHRPLNDAEPIAPATLPDPPAHLTPRALEEWNRAGMQLKDAGLISNLDRNQFANYCMAFARMVEAEEQLAKFGMLVKAPSGYPMTSPLLGIVNTCVAQMLKYAAEFGLTPSSRSRIRVDADAPNDEFEKYLQRGPDQKKPR